MQDDSGLVVCVGFLQVLAPTVQKHTWLAWLETLNWPWVWMGEWMGVMPLSYMSLIWEQAEYMWKEGKDNGWMEKCTITNLQEMGQSWGRNSICKLFRGWNRWLGRSLFSLPTKTLASGFITCLNSAVKMFTTATPIENRNTRSGEGRGGCDWLKSPVNAGAILCITCRLRRPRPRGGTWNCLAAEMWRGADDLVRVGCKEPDVQQLQRLTSLHLLHKHLQVWNWFV